MNDYENGEIISQSHFNAMKQMMNQNDSSDTNFPEKKFQEILNNELALIDWTRVIPAPEIYIPETGDILPGDHS